MAAVAVGRTRDAAAAVFGRSYDELFVTTFADFAEAPDAGDVLVTAEDGASDLVARILAADAERRVVLQVAGEPPEHLAEVAGARYDATYVDGRPCLVIAATGRHESALAALDALSSTTPPAPPADPKPLPVPRLYGRIERRATATDSRLRRAAAALPRALGATSRRGKLAVLLALALGAALLVLGVPLAVGLIGGDSFAWIVALLFAALAGVLVAALAILLLLLDKVRQ